MTRCVRCGLGLPIIPAAGVLMCGVCIGKALIEANPLQRCSRCGRDENCLQFGVQSIAVCEDCLSRIVGEWKIRRDDFAELSAS
jgi:predicted amidophosphoribosyltransferase